MQYNIQTKYDKLIKGYVVSMPESISLVAIEEWKESIGTDLRLLPNNQKVVMLIDTNKHQFESIKCLKILRELFTNNEVLQSNGVKAAFVQPQSHMEPHIKSEHEAYFDNVSSAYKWLQA